MFSDSAFTQRIGLAEDGIWQFRDIGRPFQTHNSLTTSWNIVQFPITPVVWFTYYSLLHDVLMHLDQNELHNRPILYLHANVYSPFSVVLHAMYRFTIYKMFLFNTPPEMYFCISQIKFRFFFMSTTALPREEIFIQQLIYRVEYTVPRYYDLECEQ